MNNGLLIIDGSAMLTTGLFLPKLNLIKIMKMIISTMAKS